MNMNKLNSNRIINKKFKEKRLIKVKIRMKLIIMIQKSVQMAAMKVRLTILKVHTIINNQNFKKCKRKSKLEKVFKVKMLESKLICKIKQLQTQSKVKMIMRKSKISLP